MTRSSNEKFRIEIANQQARSFDSQRLIDAVVMILRDAGIEESEISIAVVDDATIQQLNRSYLGHDYATDVITFPLDCDPEKQLLSGQLVVSSDTAAQIASQLGIEMDDELLLYVVHGTLHLVGFDDKQPGLARSMRAAEQACFERLGVTYHWPDDLDQEPNSSNGAEA